MDVVDAGTHLRFKMMRHQAVQNRKFGTGRLKGNHIGVHCVDFRDNVLKLAVAHMGVNLRFRFYLCVAETECLDRKVQIVAMPVGAAERQLFPERGFVNLNNTDAYRIVLRDRNTPPRRLARRSGSFSRIARPI